MARNGKLVIRPDSGDPVDITCGFEKNENGDILNSDSEIKNGSAYYRTPKNTPEEKGVIELLWDIFGGTISKEGYKVLDSHIGAIYGDSITLSRQVQIYERLANKGFAATNIVLGVGSYTYQFNTRDTMGYAAKGAWFESEGKGYDIYKDPATDDGTKKSLRGFCQVYNDRPDCGFRDLLFDGNDNLVVRTRCSKEQEADGLLQIIYEDGKFFNQTTLNEVRERIRSLSNKFL